MKNTSTRSKSKRQKYPSDLSKNGWKNLRPLLPKAMSNAKTGGRPQADMREVINGIFYVVKTGCQWRSIPHDLAPWQTCYGYFRRFSLDGTWCMVNTYFVRKVRKKVHGRNVRPSAAIIDSQSCKSSSCGGDWTGFDSGKKVKGRKRFILTDTEGLLLAVWICAASVSEKEGAKQLLRAIRMHPLARKMCRVIRLVWTDAGYRGQDLIDYAKSMFNWKWVPVLRQAGQKGFVVLARRWVVERTFAWILNSRRLARDYEKTRHSAQAMVYLAMLPLMLKRLDRF